MNRLLLAALLASATAACAEKDPAPTGTADATATADAGIFSDAGASPDADAGASPDADAASLDSGSASPDADTADADSCDPVATAREALGAVDAVAGPSITASEDADVTTLTVDASAGGVQGQATEPYVYLDLATLQQVEISDTASFTDGSWWIAFKRSSIRINGGDSGPGPLLMTSVEGSFEDAAAPGPQGEWLTDDFVSDTCEVDANERGIVTTAFGDWYDYDFTTHTVQAPENTTFFVYNAGSHAAYRLFIDSWDDGVYELRVGSL